MEQKYGYGWKSFAQEIGVVVLEFEVLKIRSLTGVPADIGFLSLFDI